MLLIVTYVTKSKIYLKFTDVNDKKIFFLSEKPPITASHPNPVCKGVFLSK